MAGLLGNPSFSFSDNVLPRLHLGERRRAAFDIAMTPQVLDAPTPALVSSYGETTNSLLSLEDSPPPRQDSRPAQLTSDNAKVTGKRKAPSYYNTSIRRQQCRVNQARYRNRQRMAQVELEQSVENLRQEVDSLKRRYGDLSSRERSSQSPWNIVAEVFHLLESSFRSPWRVTSTKEMLSHPQTRLAVALLKKAFAHDATMGELRGADALMEQLRLYSQCYGEPRLKLKRIESVSAGVIAARVRLSVTITEYTLKHIFPHLDSRRGEDNGHRLYERLLGQRLELACTMTFLFDDLSCRVARLETSIDLVAALLQVFGNLEDVALALEHARITPESTISVGL